MKQEISTLPEHFQHYIGLVKEKDVQTAFEQQSEKDFHFFQSLSDAQSNIKYAEDKWTIKEVLQHLIDSERIFAYRVLAIVRGEQSELPGFNENLYVKNAHAKKRTRESLIAEFQIVRKATIALIKSLDKEDLDKMGKAGGHPISAEAMLFTTVGHVMHHIEIIKKRYLRL